MTGGETRAPLLRLAELVAAVSLATDLAHDVPLESALRDAVVALGFARLAGLRGDDLTDVYYLALLYHVGCTAAAEAQSKVGGGDDISARHWYSEADYTNRPEFLRLAATRVAREWGPVARAQAVAGLMGADRRFMSGAFANICEVAARLCERLGGGPRVTAALEHAYARWDGQVFFDLPKGESISLLARVVHLVHVAQVFHRAGGREAADAVVRSRRGTEFDPQLADLWLADSGELLRPLGPESVWELALAAEPEPHRLVPRSHIDQIASAFADFVDLKSSYTLGHSTKLAELAAGAGATVGLDEAGVNDLRRAAQVHDLGNVSVPNRIWTKAGPLNRAEWERVRLHPYQTQRVLMVAEPLRVSGELAGMHHERLDGSGYHRGLPAASIPMPARLLAAAEVYQSLLEERPWRAALPQSEAATQLREEMRQGRLDRQAVDAVLEAAGQPRSGRRASQGWPGNLTDREVEVLRMVARGRSNKDIARALHVSDATVHTHVINVYGKIEVKTRAGAALFALEHDLIQL